MSGPASNSPGGMHTHKQPCYPCAQQLSFQPGAKMGHKSKVSMLFLRGKIPQRGHGGAPGYLKKTALVKQRCRGVDCRGCFSVPSGWRHRGWQPTACPPLSLFFPFSLVAVYSLPCWVSLPQVIFVEPGTCLSSQNPSPSASISSQLVGRTTVLGGGKGRAWLGHWLCKL